jgi:NAD(P)-dependent dehydrogenase (short-subunit alcohol dehydrogenase family)
MPSCARPWRGGLDLDSALFERECEVATMSSLYKNVCVVTGASRGIGRAVAEDLAAAGALVATCAVQEPPLAGDWRARCDVSDEEQVGRFFADCEMRLGPPDVVVLNAGVLERGAIDELSSRQWDRVLDVNLKGAFLCARAAWPSMKARRKGRIIALGSISGTLGTPLTAAYNASKWGLTGFIKSIAEEGRDHGIFCAIVQPGSTHTDMLAQSTFPPQMEPQDVAKVVRFLAAEAPFAMTGSAVEVFG